MHSSHGDLDGISQGTVATRPGRARAFGPTSQPSSHSARQDEFSQTVPRHIPHPVTLGQLPLLGTDRTANRSSATWTLSSGDLTGLSDTDDIQDRSEFVQEYNRLAMKHGIRPLAYQERSLSPASSPSPPKAEAFSELVLQQEGRSLQQHRRGWFSRTFLRQASVTSATSSGRSTKRRQKRSISNIAMHIVHRGAKRDSLKDEDLQSLVRLCGKSTLYLPSEYAPSSLVLPTCFRATAQYLIQHAADTRSIFRIPGSVRIVNALYEYYCAEADPDAITYTMRCPNLPLHINAGTHDVASAFKRLLAGLPGGILGSLTLFDALVAIHSQLSGDTEFTRTKQPKLRARLIALAVGSVRSQFRRELICAVFGLLCLIGRTAERAPREDGHGRPLPTADLMGYNALGIVFGPLLVGDLINSYSMGLANPNSGLILFPVTPPNVSQERRKTKALEDADPRILTVDKIHVANDITEMLITHWREVVKHMRSLGGLKNNLDEITAAEYQRRRNPGLRPSASEPFVIRKPAEWTCCQPPPAPYDMAESPTPPSPSPAPRAICRESRPGIPRSTLSVPRRRRKYARSLCSNRSAMKGNVQPLSPTTEEPTFPDIEARSIETCATPSYGIPPPSVWYAAPMEEPILQVRVPSEDPAEGSRAVSESATLAMVETYHPTMQFPRRAAQEAMALYAPTRQRRLVVSKDFIRFSDGPDSQQMWRGNSGRRGLHRSNQSPSSLALAETAAGSPVMVIAKRCSRDSTESIISGSKDGRFQTTIAKRRKSIDPPTISPKETAKLHDDAQSTVKRKQGPAALDPAEPAGKAAQEVEQKSIALELKQSRLSLYKPRHLRSASPDARKLNRYSYVFNERDTGGDISSAPGGLPERLDSPRAKAVGLLDNQRGLGFGHSTTGRRRQCLGLRGSRMMSIPKSPSVLPGQSLPEKAQSAPQPAENSGPTEHCAPNEMLPAETVMHGLENEQAAFDRTPLQCDDAGGLDPTISSARCSSTNTNGSTLEQETPTTPDWPRTGRPTGSAVKAMAAEFERASQDPVFVPSPMRNLLRPRGVISQYAVHPSPKKGENSSTKSNGEPKLGSTDPSLTSRPSVVWDKGSRDSVEMLRVERSEEALARKEGTYGIIDDVEDGEGKWIRRYSTPQRPGGVGSQTPTDVAGDLTQDGLPLHTKDDTLVPLSSAMQTSPRRREHFSEPGRDLDRTIPKTERAMGFSHALEPQPRSNDTDSFGSPGLDKETRSPWVLPLVGGVPALSPGAGSGNLTLHAQIRNFQKQVAAKTEEVKQLRRLLEAKQDTDATLLREQLRLTERDRASWQERAEKAEKWVAAFERVSAKMKRLKDDMVDKEGEASIPTADGALGIIEWQAKDFGLPGREENDIDG